MDACVFLNTDSQKMVVDRTGAAALPLNRSGVDISRRFTFYDQVHTTGTDIKQVIDAKALVTLGKDMTFRDFKQGCWRMRDIGQGQTMKVLVTPKIRELIHKVARVSSKEPLNLSHICCWLMHNSLQVIQ